MERRRIVYFMAQDLRTVLRQVALWPDGDWCWWPTTLATGDGVAPVKGVDGDARGRRGIMVMMIVVGMVNGVIVR